MSSRRKTYERLMSEVDGDKAERESWPGGIIGPGFPVTVHDKRTHSRTMYAIRNGGFFYKHGYPSGHFVDFPGQLYASKAAASRQRNSIDKGVVVEVTVQCPADNS